MPNLVVDKYRKWFPEDTRSDAELTLYLGDLGRSKGIAAFESNPQFRTEYLDLKQALAPSLPAEFTRSFGYGTDIAQGQLYSTAELAGRITGIGPLERFGRQGYERNLQEAAGNEPTISDIRDVRNFPEAVRYGLGLAGSQAPQLGATLAGGVGGFAVGGVAGAGIGAGAVGFTQMQNYSDLVKSGVDPNTAVPVAIGVGGVGSVLEALVPYAVTLKWFRKAGTDAVKKSLGSVLAHVPIGALAEGTTEVLQEITTIAGEQYAHRDDPKYRISPEEIRRRIINAGAAGAVLGGGLGGAGAALAPSDTGAVVEEEPQTETAPPPTQPIRTPPPQPPVTAPPSAPPVDVVPSVPGAYPITPDVMAQLEALAVREVAGQVVPLELNLILNTPELRVAYEQVREKAIQNAAQIRLQQENDLRQRVGVAPLVQEEGQAGVVPPVVHPPGPPSGISDIVQQGGQVPEAIAPVPPAAPQPPPPPAPPPVAPPPVPEPPPVSPVVPPPGEVVERVKRARRKAAEIGAGIIEEQKQVEAAKPFDIDRFMADLDWDESGTQVQGEAFDFNMPDVTQLGNVAALEEILAKGARADEAGTAMSDKGNTKRVTFVEDRDTGKVLGLGTRLSSINKRVKTAEGKATFKSMGHHVVLANPDPSKKTGISLKDLLAKRSKADPTAPRYIPLASTRYKSPRKVMRLELTRPDYDALAVAAKAKIGSQESTRSVMEAKMPETGFGEEEERLEYSGEFKTPEEIEEESSQMFGGIFTEDDAKFFFKKMEKSAQPTSASKAAQVVLENAGELRLIFGRILRDAAPDGVLKGPDGKVVGAEQARDLLVNYVARKLEDAYETYQRNKPAGERKLLGAKGLAEEAGQSPAVQPGTGQAGRVQGDDPRSRLARQKPAGTQKPNGEIIARYNRLVQRLVEYGVPVQAVDKMVEVLEGEANLGTRSIVLTLDDATNPRYDTLWLLLHESAHIVFNDLPPETRSLILSAVVKMNNRALDIEGTRDVRLHGLVADQLAKVEAELEAQAPPEVPDKKAWAKQWAPLIWTEERLVEHLTQMGMEKGTAEGFIRALIRAVRELYIRALMALQRAMKRTPSEQMALEYMRIRYMQVITGDRDSLGFIGFIVPNPQPAAMAALYIQQARDARNLSESIDPTARYVELPLAVPDSKGAIDYNWENDERRRSQMSMPFLLPTQLRAGVYGTAAEQQLNDVRPFKLKPVNGKLPAKALLTAMPATLPAAEWDLYKEEGIEAWLNSRKDAITPQELQDWIDTHGPQLETVPLYAEKPKRVMTSEQDQLMVEWDEVGQKISEIQHGLETESNGPSDFGNWVWRVTRPDGYKREYGFIGGGGWYLPEETGHEDVKLVSVSFLNNNPEDRTSSRVTLTNPNHAELSRDKNIRQHSAVIKTLWALYEREHYLRRRFKAFSIEDPNWNAVSAADVPSATRTYHQLNPKPLNQMPGAVDLLVRIPLGKAKGWSVEKYEDGWIAAHPNRITGNLYPTREQAEQSIPKEPTTFQAGHFEHEDKNIVSWVRGYFETLPNGDKVFFISELQSDWAQKYWKLVDAAKNGKMGLGTDGHRWTFILDTNRASLMIKATDLPGMDIDQALAWVRANPEKAAQFGQKTPSFVSQYYEQLALKAAIKHALDNGAKHIAISDAQTAMLTERHDQLAQAVRLLPDRPVTFRANDGHVEFVTSEWAGQTNFGQIPNKWIAEGRIGKAPDGVYALVKSHNYPEGLVVRIDNPNDPINGRNTTLANAIAQEYPNGEGLSKDGEHPLIPQEKGMRFHYDTSIPRILKDLTGYDGMLEKFGTHQNAVKLEPGVAFLEKTFDSVDRANQIHDSLLAKYGLENVESTGATVRVLRSAVTSPEKWVSDNGWKESSVGMPRDNLWFKNPDGTPQTEILGRIYNLDKVASALNVRGGFTVFSKRWMRMLPEIPGAAERFVKVFAYVAEATSSEVKHIFKTTGGTKTHKHLFEDLKDVSDEDAAQVLFNALINVRKSIRGETEAVASARAFDRLGEFFNKNTVIPYVERDNAFTPPGLTPEQAWDYYPWSSTMFDSMRAYVVGSEDMAKLGLNPPKFRWSRREGIGERSDKSVVPNTDIAANNEQKEVEARVLVELGRIPEVVADAQRRGISLVKWLRSAGGLQDADGLIKIAQNRLDPQTGSLIDGIDPGFRINRFTDDASKDRARLSALKMLSSAAGKIGRRIEKAKTANEALEKKREESAKELQNSARNYTDLEGLTKLMTGQVRVTLRRLFRDLNKDSQRLGVIGQQLRVLEGSKVVMSNFARVFADMYSTGQLDGDRLMKFLNAIANDTAIDLSLPIDVIRRELLKNPAYVELTQETPESKALLATIIGYAKINPRLVALVNLRRVADPERRIAINNKVDELLRQGISVADRIGRLTRVATIEDRLLRAYREDMQTNKHIVNEIKKNNLTIKGLEAALPFFQEAVNQISGPLEVRAPTNYGDGFVYFVPPEATSGNDAVIGNQKTIKLTGDVTPRAEVETNLAKMTEWLHARYQAGAIDGLYHTVLAQRDEISRNGIIIPEAIKTGYTATGLAMADAAIQFKAFGTAAARVLGQMVNRFAAINRSLQGYADTQGRKNEQARAAAIKIMAEGSRTGASIENYLSIFYSPAVEFLEHQRDIAELYPGDTKKQWDVAFERMLNHFLDNDDKKALLSGREMRFMSALRKHIQTEWETSQFWDKHLSAEGVGVVDAAIMLGEGDNRVAALRKRTVRGLVTIPRGLSKRFYLAATALDKKNWAEAASVFDMVDKLYELHGAAAVAQAVQKYFDDPDIREFFFQALAIDKDTESAFPAPRLQDGTQPEADPVKVKRAYEMADGNVAVFIENLYNLHHGETNTGTYYKDILTTFAQYYGEMTGVRRKVDPQGMSAPRDWEHMIPAFMVHSRKMEHWPSVWTQHLSFDRINMTRAAGRSSAEIAFGIDSVRFAQVYDTLVRETKEASDILRSAIGKMEQTVVTSKRSVVEDELAKEVGGKAELARLRKLTEMNKLLTAEGSSIRDQLMTHFRGSGSPVAPISLGMRLVQLFSSLMLNQPASAIGQFADLFGNVLAFGLSPQTIKQTARVTRTALSDLAGGLFWGLGLNWQANDEFKRRYIETGQGDPLGAAKISDLMLTETSPYTGWPQWLSSVARKVGEVQEIGLKRGEGAPVTIFRPFAPFKQINLIINRAVVTNLWRWVNELVGRGIEVYNQRQAGVTDAEMASWTVEQWVDAIKPSMGKGPVSNLITLMRDDWGLDFYRLVKEGATNRTKGDYVLSDRTLKLLQGLAIKEITSEANISTMPLAAFNSSILRFILPLLGWPFRRSQKIARKRLNVSGEYSTQALMQGLLALAVAGAGGLGISMLVDLYNEELLRKRRNLRRLSAEGGVDNLALAIVEHTARVGTLGLFGDIANEIVNVGTGEGANRGISLDQRVVFVNSLLGLWRSAAAFVNQDFEVDYNGVVRPALYSLGGNGVLQYLQLFGVSGVEGTANKRTNVGNWLRAVGRELEFEVQTSRGGYSTPTPMTPHITRMVMATYEDDRSAFRDAYREAVAEAKEQGHRYDAEEYVRNAFRSRHPLRSTFRVALTAQQYRKLLRALPEDGRDAVDEAVKLFNRYGQGLGVEPFTGKEERVQDRLPRINLGNARRSAAAMLYSF